MDVVLKIKEKTKKIKRGGGPIPPAPFPAGGGNGLTRRNAALGVTRHLGLRYAYPGLGRRAPLGR